MVRVSLSSLLVALGCLSRASGYGNGSPSCDVKVPRHGGRPLGRAEADSAGYNITKEQQVDGWKVTVWGPPMKGLLINTNSPGQWVDLDGSLFKSMKIGGNCITQRKELPEGGGSSEGGQDSSEEDGDSSEEDGDSSEEGDDSSEEDNNDNGNSAFSFWFRRRNSNNQRAEKISTNGSSSYTFTYKTEGDAEPTFDVIIVETYRKYYTGILV